MLWGWELTAAQNSDEHDEAEAEADDDDDDDETWRAESTGKPDSAPLNGGKLIIMGGSRLGTDMCIFRFRAVVAADEDDSIADDDVDDDDDEEGSIRAAAAAISCCCCSCKRAEKASNEPCSCIGTWTGCCCCFIAAS